jgi:hypothetical protein
MLTTGLAKRQEQAMATIGGEDPFTFSPQIVKKLRLLSMGRVIVLLAS